MDRQAVHIFSRPVVVAPEVRSRVNTALVFITSLAGAVGSAVISPLWSAGG